MKLQGYILKLALILVCAASLSSCMGRVPVDVVMDGEDLFFVLEKPEMIEFVRVRAIGAAPGSAINTFWLMGYDTSTPVESRKYLKLDRILYGGKYDGFSRSEGPATLRKNIAYIVEIRMPGKFAREVFVITGDNTVIMPGPAFERQKKRAHEVSAGKSGDKIFTPK